MATKIFNMPKPHNSGQRDGYDYSFRYPHISRIGEERPILAIETMPNEDFSISLDEFTRTIPMSDAPFARMRRHFEFYFVPIAPQLWRDFNLFKAEREDPVTQSSISMSRGGSRFAAPQYHPYVNLRALIIQLHDLYANTGIFSDLEPTSDTLANSERDVCGFMRVHSAIMLLSDLGYGDFSWLLDDQTYSWWFNSAQENVKDSYNYDVNVWPILAYQKVWYDFHRNATYDNEWSNLPFNVDFLSGLGGTRQKSDYNLLQTDALKRWFVMECLQMRYHQYKKDLYTAAYPTPQFGAEAQLSWNTNIISQVNVVEDPVIYTTLRVNNRDESTDTIPAGAIYNPLSSTPQYDVENQSLWQVSGLSVYAIKKAEALQAWREQQLRAGSRTRDLFDMMYGVTPKYDTDYHPEWIGSMTEDIVNDVVTQTTHAATGEVSDTLGTLGANGVGSSEHRTFRYHCRDFGVILCVAYTIPELDYPNYAILKERCHLERYDYFTDQFQDLGFVPVTQKEISNVYSMGSEFGSVYSDLSPRSAFNEVVGYAPSYYEYKQRRDVLGIGFNPRWLVRQPDGANPSTLLYGSFGDKVIYQFGVMHKAVQSGLGRFYISPSVGDSIFIINANDTPNYDTYPFQHECAFNITRVNLAHRLGLPNWNI